jgi:hypothetical protein
MYNVHIIIVIDWYLYYWDICSCNSQFTKYGCQEIFIRHYSGSYSFCCSVLVLDDELIGPAGCQLDSSFTRYENRADGNCVHLWTQYHDVIGENKVVIGWTCAGPLRLDKGCWHSQPFNSPKLFSSLFTAMFHVRLWQTKSTYPLTLGDEGNRKSKEG